jgi:hypothetical protein
MNPLAGLTEAQFQAEVMRVAVEHGWRTMHVGRARVGRKWVTPTSTNGWPDLTLLRPPQLVCLELKRVGGTVRPGQREWIEALQQVPGVEAYIVGPEDAHEVWHLLASRPTAR